VHRVGDTSFCDSPLGATELAEAERFPEPVAEEEAGSLHAPMPGTVVRVEVADGASVTAGTVVVVLEAMKMEHAVRAPHDGTVTSLHATVGQAVDTGHVLAVVTEP
jgi:biotin carboxyl carrier protein